MNTLQKQTKLWEKIKAKGAGSECRRKQGLEKQNERKQTRALVIFYTRHVELVTAQKNCDEKKFSRAAIHQTI